LFQKEAERRSPPPPLKSCPMPCLDALKTFIQSDVDNVSEKLFRIFSY
jgi:hypothetical protein